MHKIKEMTMKPFVLKQWENKKPLKADRLTCPSRKILEEQRRDRGEAASAGWTNNRHLTYY
jgi:hypothetical protein